MLILLLVGEHIGQRCLHCLDIHLILGIRIEATHHLAHISLFVETHNIDFQHERQQPRVLVQAVINQFFYLFKQSNFSF